MLRALDLFCGAGGATKGLQMAGFHVTGVDIKPQPRYCGDEFFQADAMEFPIDGYDFIWASPPCQAWSESTPIEARKNHVRLIAPIRIRLEAIGVPYCIENVDCARAELRASLMLCGTMFGMNVWRHRWFEFRPHLHFMTPGCRHLGHPVVVSGSAHGRGEATVPEMIEALEVPWMKIRAEARQAIPPAYSEFIGRQAIAFIESQRTEQL